MLDRIIGVFKLDRQVFLAVARDEAATTQAAIVVAIVAALSVVGTLLGAMFNVLRGQPRALAGALLGVIVTFVLTFINWGIWSVVTYFVGTELFKGKATLNEMLRVIGFAYAPRMLSVIPCIGGLIGAIWSLIASYVGIKAALELDDVNTIITILVGWLIIVILGSIVGALGVGGAVGFGVLRSLVN